MTSEDSPDSSIPETLLLYSNKPPEEARIFGFRGDDIQALRAPPEEETPVSPDQWGFTSPNPEGICKYCQLMLHPDVPSLIEHQPNLQSLIHSGEICSVCKWLEISIQRGSPWLVARYIQGDPVFCDKNSIEAPVRVRMAKNASYTCVVASVGTMGFHGNNGLPLTVTTPSRLGDLATRRFWIPHDEIDESTPFKRMDILKTWVNECANHEICSTLLPSTHNTKLPSRVLDLSGSPDVPSKLGDVKIKLKECQEGEEGTYIALSYCWGSNPEFHFKTTQETLNKHRDGIDYASLPLTQREAILATLYLGIRYLWIDSMCIIQDSPHDWEAESARMGSIYSNACLTLAATSSDSPKDGLLFPFQGAECIKIHGETTMLRMETHRTIDRTSEPLNIRGWTLQEAVLASRLVCFGNEQWLWKCPSRYATEDGLIDGPRHIDNGLIPWAVLADRGPGKDGKAYLRGWYRLISNYSKRHLTYQDDKYNAIAGLADMFASQTGYQYLAGLWAEDLANGLMWEATSRGVVREPNSIPSWSWASVKGEVKAYEFTNELPNSMLELTSVDQQWEGVPLASPLKVARLTVKGMMLQATLGQRTMTQELRHRIIAAPESEEILGEAFLDTKLLVEHEIDAVWFLFVHGVRKGSQEKEYCGLLLVPVPNETEAGDILAYRRLGFGVLWKKSKFEDDRGEGSDPITSASSTTIVLV
ncbi:hypothetical protein HJFPF1_04369 [Paramyrothecium foliicola]|nr:hypothetical protein HJFPF1_04369 [Paramyrothecium foliicola]